MSKRNCALSLRVQALAVFAMTIASSCSFRDSYAPVEPQERWARASGQEEKADGWTDSFQTHEPIIVGIAHDERSKRHLDVRLSFKYLLWDMGKVMEESESPCSASVRELQVFVAFSTRFSQYVGTRESSPVVARRFNPELFVRWNREDSYINVGYGHESNGQSVDSQAEFTAKKMSLAADGDDTDSALDYVSRGWDHVGATWGQQFRISDQGFRTELQLRYFLQDGLLQGPAEDSFAFEGVGRRERADYDGIILSLIHGGRADCHQTTLEFRTGYSEPLQNTSFRIEHVHKWRDLPPIVVWAQTGYNSDLAHYYQRVDTIGIGIDVSF